MSEIFKKAVNKLIVVLVGQDGMGGSQGITIHSPKNLKQRVK